MNNLKAVFAPFDAAEGAYLGADGETLDLSIAHLVHVRDERIAAFRPLCIVPAFQAAIVGG
ncbi:hypothetical protein [uncultured Sphingomonas sp.]|uniref:hypothetical protein n=1 Tax=uncultured Sphingomonas sp. TaxID=158754 RepID=UPI0035CC1612